MLNNYYKKSKKIISFVLLFAFPLAVYTQICGDKKCDPNESCIRDCRLDTITLLMKEGGRIDWSYGKNNLIAFDKEGADGFYDVYTMNTDGTNIKCITNNPQLPQKHNGQPAWHPSGEWLVFQSEKKEHEGKSRFSTPGRGVWCDLWIGSADATKFFPLRVVPNEKGKGTLHAHFSHDGKKLSWSELYEPASFKTKGKSFGQFKLMVADFYIDSFGVPKLKNIKQYIPGDSVFYENHGFSPDGKYLLFSSNYYKNVSPLGGNKLYRLDLETGKATVLADVGYNEHATYSPDGKYIVWGTNRDNKKKGMDYWIMNADGSNKQRLTYFNVKGYPEYEKKKLLAVDMSWSPDCKYILAYVQDGVAKDAGRIYLISFKDPVGK